MEAVTVVIPARNRPDLLRVTLMSVLRQRLVDLRVIVVDDASTTDITSVVSQCADPRVRIARQTVPKGVSAARNRGLAEAGTEWVAFCDDDDLWSPDKLWCQLASARSLGRDWVYAGCVLVNADLDIQGGTPPLAAEALRAALQHYNAVPAGASNVVVRTDSVRQIGGFDENLTHVPDWDLWIHLARNGLPACVNEPFVGYRIHATNASFRASEMLAELAHLERRHGLTKTRSRFHRHLAHLGLKSGRRGEALRHLLRAILRFGDGYSRMDLEEDVRLLREHATELVWSKVRRPPPQQVAARLQAEKARDPHAAWKARAQTWLRELAC